jgi:RNA ligase (TIGR02306 family)
MNLEMQGQFLTKDAEERKLASIQEVSAVRPHPNADRLELITVLGWQVCEVKGQLQVGDTIIYCEIDSLLPATAPWLPAAVKQRIAAPEGAEEQWFHVKTIKLRGEISQGLILPFTPTLKEVLLSSRTYDGVAGDNVTDELGIRKYDIAIVDQFEGAARNDCDDDFPTHLLSKTNEIRVQSEPQLFDQLRGLPYYATVKMDGTSVTFLWHPFSVEERELLDGDEDGKLWVCSRNRIVSRGVNNGKSNGKCAYQAMAEKYGLANILRQHPHLAVQGEICGPNIQKNWANLPDLQLFVFNVVDISPQHSSHFLDLNRRRLSFSDMLAWCQAVGLPTVPVEEFGEAFEYDNQKLCIERARGNYPSSKWPREGLVYRSQDQKISFKVINNDYLLKRGE